MTPSRSKTKPLRTYVHMNTWSLNWQRIRWLMFVCTLHEHPFYIQSVSTTDEKENSIKKIIIYLVVMFVWSSEWKAHLSIIRFSSTLSFSIEVVFVNKLFNPETTVQIAVERYFNNCSKHRPHNLQRWVKFLLFSWKGLLLLAITLVDWSHYSEEWGVAHYIAVTYVDVWDTH